jgi:hypothetical protein
MSNSAVKSWVGTVGLHTDVLAHHDLNRALPRRAFLRASAAAGAAFLVPTPLLADDPRAKPRLPSAGRHPPREFSLCPFWCWNDDLSESELDRQLADFQAHGVHAFVIHPRAGLPRSIGWLNERMIHFMRFAIERAKARGMWVVLYDEGMYPSGSSSAQVVAKNPAFPRRGPFAIDLDEAKPGDTVHGVRLADDRQPPLASRSLRRGRKPVDAHAGRRDARRARASRRGPSPAPAVA